MNKYDGIAVDTTDQIIRCAFNPVFVAQMLTYLRVTGLRVVLILPSNREGMREGRCRVGFE